MTDIISRFIPVFLILAVGAFFRYKGILSDEIVAGLKKLIINLGLPAVFFLSFLTMELKSSYIIFFISTFLICLLLFFVGTLFQKFKSFKVPLLPFFFTGFEFGMVGVALFSSLFGLENLHYILLLGLGHEFFIWFVYAPLLEAQNHGRIQVKKILKSFISSPIIIAILSALFLNLTGLYMEIASFFVVTGVISTMDVVSKLTTPLILLAVGFQLKLTSMQWQLSIKILISRLILSILSGLLLYFISDRWIMEMNRMMLYAFITFFLLPPPFIIPVFLGKELKKESVFYSNLLVLYTIVTLILYAVIMLILGM
jgi:malate permease and related proteins